MRDVLAAWLSSLSAEELAAEVLALADDDPGLRLRLELKAAARTADVRALRRAVAGLLETDGHLDSGEAEDYADDVYQVAAAIDSLASGEPGSGGRAAVEVAREAFGLVVDALANADDSAGVIADAAREVLAVHLRACAAADPPPDPVGLGTYLADLVVRDRAGITPNLEEYSALLGRDGALAIRRRITDVHEAEPDNPNARYLAEAFQRSAGGGQARPPADRDDSGR